MNDDLELSADYKILSMMDRKQLLDAYNATHIRVYELAKDGNAGRNLSMYYEQYPIQSDRLEFIKKLLIG